MPSHHRADRFGYVYEHIVAAEEKYGFPITRDFTVHHKNADKGDNRPENLDLRVGNHGKGGDALDTLLRDERGRRAAATILSAHGWSVAPPPAQQSA